MKKLTSSTLRKRSNSVSDSATDSKRRSSAPSPNTGSKGSPSTIEAEPQNVHRSALNEPVRGIALKKKNKAELTALASEYNIGVAKKNKEDLVQAILNHECRGLLIEQWTKTHVHAMTTQAAKVSFATSALYQLVNLDANQQRQVIVNSSFVNVREMDTSNQTARTAAMTA